MQVIQTCPQTLPQYVPVCPCVVVKIAISLMGLHDFMISKS
ncbi:hypothetical protein Lalb_Chr07g0193311 [Lupinus albus]|uniref:Uncharacterized protein n=1 Tax=Lupinus albus TaxID=3870 RepID=A0A6A4QB00_LUPAL|nr:hypothetical protein Lalb_Chr07g0193311 [Lupinus albus]